MYYRAFIRAALVTFAVALVAGAIFVPSNAEEEGRVVEFTTVAPSVGGTGVGIPLGAPAAAREYARTHGLTECVAPADARLDDVVLTVPDGAGDPPVVTPVGFDEALRSGERGRWNVLACARP